LAFFSKKSYDFHVIPKVFEDSLKLTLGLVPRFRTFSAWVDHLGGNREHEHLEWCGGRTGRHCPHIRLVDIETRSHGILLRALFRRYPLYVHVLAFRLSGAVTLLKVGRGAP
jgi:hypothetical protein